jgi:hypothetical protein
MNIVPESLAITRNASQGNVTRPDLAHPKFTQTEVTQADPTQTEPAHAKVPRSHIVPQEVLPDTEPSRCHHRFANGKRCRLPAAESQLGLCLRHFTLHAASSLSRQNAHDDTEDLSAELLGQVSGSSVPLDIKQFLSRLLLLVSQGRISPRRAAILVYIANQILYSKFANRR